jgi:hypothetical protein
MVNRFCFHEAITRFGRGFGSNAGVNSCNRFSPCGTVGGLHVVMMASGSLIGRRFEWGAVTSLR